MSGRIGLILPCDMTLDQEYWRYVPDEVSINITRTGFHDGPLSIELALNVSDFSEIEYAAKSLTKIEPDVIGFACTSGSYLRGLEGERQLRQVMVKAGAKVAITTSSSLISALQSLGVRRIAVGTPYPENMGSLLGKFLTDAGFEPVSVINMELDEVVDRIPDEEVWRLAQTAMRPEAEALFLACTGVPTFDLLRPLEEHLHIPVLSANQVTMWEALRLANIQPAINDQYLFERTRTVQRL